MAQKSYTPLEIESLLDSVAPNLRHGWEIRNLINGKLVDLQRNRGMAVSRLEIYERRAKIMVRLAAFIAVLAVFAMLLGSLVWSTDPTNVVAFAALSVLCIFFLFQYLVSKKMPVTRGIITLCDEAFWRFETSRNKLNPMMDDVEVIDITGAHERIFGIALEQAEREDLFNTARFEKLVDGDRLRVLIKELEKIEGYYGQICSAAQNEFGLDFKREEVLADARKEYGWAHP